MIWQCSCLYLKIIIINRAQQNEPSLNRARPTSSNLRRWASYELSLCIDRPACLPRQALIHVSDFVRPWAYFDLGLSPNVALTEKSCQSFLGKLKGYNARTINYKNQRIGHSPVEKQQMYVYRTSIDHVQQRMLKRTSKVFVPMNDLPPPFFYNTWYKIPMLQAHLNGGDRCHVRHPTWTCLTCTDFTRSSAGHLFCFLLQDRAQLLVDLGKHSVHCGISFHLITQVSDKTKVWMLIAWLQR